MSIDLASSPANYAAAAIRQRATDPAEMAYRHQWAETRSSNHRNKILAMGRKVRSMLALARRSVTASITHRNYLADAMS
jgi:hypothetical protein